MFLLHKPDVHAVEDSTTPDEQRALDFIKAYELQVDAGSSRVSSGDTLIDKPEVKSTAMQSCKVMHSMLSKVKQLVTADRDSLHLELVRLGRVLAKLDSRITLWALLSERSNSATTGTS